MNSSPSNSQQSPALANQSDRYLPEGSRLFIVTSGKPVSEYVLQSVFSSFGGLEYVRMAKDKNYGYIKVDIIITCYHISFVYD